MSDLNSVHEHFEGAAKKYSSNFLNLKSGRNYEFKTRLNIVTNMLRGASGRFLDFACGSGEITASILSSGHYSDAVICDISSNMLSLASEAISHSDAAENTTFIHGDIFNYLREKRGEFDVMLCLGLIAHSGHVEELLNLANESLSPNGRLILQSSIADNWNIRIVKFACNILRINTHGYRLNYYSSSVLARLINEAGFRIEKQQRYSFSLPLGDKFWAKGNYYLENVMQSISARFGAECIYMLRKKN